MSGRRLFVIKVDGGGGCRRSLCFRVALWYGAATMPQESDSTSPDSERRPVTYVIVVHGIGEQRKNETVINVANRFAEARRGSLSDDNRDVLTLGQASGQTGRSKVPVASRPWMEFYGIPDTPNGTPPEVFLGEPSSTGDNLRFVDLCWSDVMQDSIDHVGQSVDVWARGLLGRLLRKHEDAKCAAAQVPFWIRRVLYLLASTLLLVRLAMTLRFKEMKDLVFVKFLGDVQLYGEYSRCRGRAVRRFHEMMARIEAEHGKEFGSDRNARYVVIAHSLGSIMSFDALLYASATSQVRRGCDPDWVFPGYLEDDDDAHEKRDLCQLDARRERLARRFDFLETGWVRNVTAFVTLGSPIDKYLVIWWLNYRYLLTCPDLFDPRVPQSPWIKHFNYCDELDPVGHNLDVACGTRGYQAVFTCQEDTVFNRYTTPGVAHNEYWNDRCLFRWILARGVDNKSAEDSGTSPRWFDSAVYRRLLRRLYGWVPLATLLGTYVALTLALNAPGWQIAAVAAAAFATMAVVGLRLITLSVWWRQIQRRQESSCHWTADDSAARKKAAAQFRRKIVVVPFASAALLFPAFRFTCGLGQVECSSNWSIVTGVFGGESPLRLLLVVGVVASVLCLLRGGGLPTAYRTSAVNLTNPRAGRWAVLWVLMSILSGFLAGRFLPVPFRDVIEPIVLGHVPRPALLAGLGTAVYAYRMYRFLAITRGLREESETSNFAYASYAIHPRTPSTVRNGSTAA